MGERERSRDGLGSVSVNAFCNHKSRIPFSCCGTVRSTLRDNRSAANYGESFNTSVWLALSEGLGALGRTFDAKTLGRTRRSDSLYYWWSDTRKAVMKRVPRASATRSTTIVRTPIEATASTTAPWTRV